MRIASIDIGTNTVLLLIADIDNDGIIHPLEHQQRFPRLGKEVDKKYLLSESGFEDIADVLKEYSAIANRYKINKIVACATSAVRDAVNKIEFIKYINKYVGIEIEVLTGIDEALLTYRGAISGLHSIVRNKVVLDIGGGSTEVTFKTEKDFITHSFQIGAVRLTERYFKHNPPSADEIESVRMVITDEFRKMGNIDFSKYSIIGVAGTVTTLACLNQMLQEFEVSKISGYRLNFTDVERWSNDLLRMKSSQVRLLSDTTEGREDILPAGVLILYEFMKIFKCNEVIVSERGLRYGIALREWEKQR